MLTQGQVEHFKREGYLVVPQVFSAKEVDFWVKHYMDLRENGTYPGDTAGVDIGSDDPLKRYPRMIHMHRWDKASLDFLIDQRIRQIMVALLGTEPFAVQTMLYFKPPGARGQAMHQDQYFLKTQPGTCMAAWTALDRVDEENGCLCVVPRTQNLPLLCATKADITKSFTDVTVPLPEGAELRPMRMDPGDVLFFNGQLIHGSFPNVSKNRFRRSLIGHYVVGEAKQVGKFYHPALRMDGSEVQLEESPGGGPCGTWVDQNGTPVVEMVGELSGAKDAHE